jgi:hypothetical protein
MKRRRLLAASALLVLAAAAYYYLHSRHKEPLAVAPGPLPGLLEELPAGAPVVAFVDLAALRSSPFAAQLETLAPAPAEDRDYKEFVAQTGFDYARDLDRVALAVWPGSSKTSAAAIAEGRFDREKISKYALKSGTVAQRGKLNIFTVREVLPGPRNSKPAAKTVEFAFIAPNRIALADGVELDTALASSAPTAADAALRERIERVAGARFFAAAQVKSLPKDLLISGPNSQQLARILRSVQFASLAGRPEGDRMKVALDAECDSVSNAVQLSTLLDGLRWFGRAALADPKTRRQLLPQAAALLDTLLKVLDISRQDKVVRLSMDLTPQMLGAPPKSSPPTPQPAPPQ